MPGPTVSSELRRALDRVSLMVGAVAALALGAATLLATLGGLAPDLLGLGTAAQALAVALGLFVIITGMHTAAHAYFGWRLARGVRAAAAGRYADAVRLLSPVERSGMRHYDLDGDAQRSLEQARANLE